MEFVTFPKRYFGTFGCAQYLYIPMNPEAAAAGRFAHVTSTTNWWFSLAMPCHHSMLCLLDLARACSAQVLATPPYPDSEQPCGVLSSCKCIAFGAGWCPLDA